MKKNIFILLTIVIFIFAGGYFLNSMQAERQVSASQITPLEINHLTPITLPEIQWIDINQKPVQIPEKDFTLINFWASWCAPCAVEFPELVKFAQTQKNYNVVFVSNDLKSGDIKNFINSLSKDTQDILKSADNLFMIWDKGGRITRDIFQTYKLPESYVLDKDGRAIIKINGVLSAQAYTYLSAM